MSKLATVIDAVGVVVAVLAFLLSLGTLAWSAWRFVEARRQDQAQRKFENYHKLIGELVGGVRTNQQMKLDSQIAIIFELRNFPEYAEVTARILTALHEEWSTSNATSRLLDEMQRTIRFLS